MTDTTPKAIRILVVDDNPADVLLLEEAFGDIKAVEIQVAADGERALARLRGTDARERPDMILLDLQLPGQSGLDVLKTLKADGELRKIPVLILSSSRQEADIRSAYDAHANSYVPKPRGLDNLQGLARSLETYWLEHARLPPRENAEA